MLGGFNPIKGECQNPCIKDLDQKCYTICYTFKHRTVKLILVKATYLLQISENVFTF